VTNPRHKKRGRGACARSMTGCEEKARADCAVGPRLWVRKRRLSPNQRTLGDFSLTTKQAGLYGLAAPFAGLAMVFEFDI